MRKCASGRRVRSWGYGVYTTHAQSIPVSGVCGKGRFRGPCDAGFSPDCRPETRRRSVRVKLRKCGRSTALSTLSSRRHPQERPVNFLHHRPLIPWRRNSVSARPEGNTKTTKSPFVAEGDAGVQPELLSMKAQERV